MASLSEWKVLKIASDQDSTGFSVKDQRANTRFVQATYSLCHSLPCLLVYFVWWWLFSNAIKKCENHSYFPGHAYRPQCAHHYFKPQ